MSEPAVPLVPVPADIVDRLQQLGAPPQIGQAKPYQALANHPHALRGWVELSWGLRRGALAPGRLRELAIIRVATLAGADVERAAHETVARDQFGVSTKDLEAIAHWRDSPLFTAADRVALALADAMYDDCTSDDLVKQLKEQFEPAWIVDLVTSCGFYLMSTRVFRALRIQ